MYGKTSFSLRSNGLSSRAKFVLISDPAVGADDGFETSDDKDESGAARPPVPVELDPRRDERGDVD